MNPSYNLRQRKIYDDYQQLSDEKLMEYVNNASKYDDSVIEIIRDILMDRQVLEAENPQENGPLVEKQRHGCVTAWLVFTIVANALVSIVYMVAGSNVLVMLPEESRMVVILVLVICGLMNVYFATLLLRWKKSGFTGIAIVSCILFFINLSVKIGIGRSLVGLVGIFILYGILQIEKDGISAWNNLE